MSLNILNDSGEIEKVSGNYKVDSVLNSESTNAVQNKVITEEFNKITSHIGMIIHTTTLDTMEKVIAIYGGTEWKQIQNVFLQGAGTYNAGSSVSAGLPNITGTLIGDSYGASSNIYWSGSGALGASGDNSGSGIAQYSSSGSGTHRSKITLNAKNSSGIYGNSSTVQPPSYVVYIWERTA